MTVNEEFGSHIAEKQFSMKWRKQKFAKTTSWNDTLALEEHLSFVI